MATGIKSLAKDTAIYGLSSIIGRFVNWMLVPMYTRVLVDPGEYGIVTELYGWVALLLILLTYGMETGFFRFINKKGESNPLRVYGTVLYGVLSTSILFTATVLLFLNPVGRMLGYANHPEFIGIMTVTVAIDAFLCLPFAYLRYQGKAMRFATFKLLIIGITIFLNIFFLLICPQIHPLHPEWIAWFYQADYGVGYIFVSNLLATLFTLILLLPDMLPGLRSKMDLRLLRQILNYSFPILLLGIAGIFNQTADKILFRFLFDDKEYAAGQLGIYGACFKIAVVMVMFIQAFRYAYEPFIFAKNKSDDNRKAYIEAMRYFIMFALFIFLSVMFYMDVLKHFVPAGYYAGLSVVPVVMLGELFFGIYFNLSIWYKLTDKTMWGACFSAIGCVATVAIILLFVPRFGFIACAWASFASNLLMMMLSYFIGRKKFPVAYNLRSALYYSLLAAGLYLAGMYLPIDSLVWRLIYRSVLLIIFFAFIVRSIRIKE
ncbi:MAG: oligosaccharide flippase family protein [Tannerella sp.]|jgi:O-antigen/teichoic acid export membrane protein|nr:oligosaccharide flippase family protein [Tannerella sp.]